MSDKFEYIKKLYEDYSPKLKFSKIYDDVTIPSKRPDDAGYDIYARLSDPALIIEPHTTVLVPTGLRVWVPDGYYMQLFERGSTGSKGLGLRAGVIDSSYKGEIFVAMTNHNPDRVILLKPGMTAPPGLENIWDNYLIYPTSKAVAQGVLLPVVDIDAVEIDDEKMQARETDRGEGSLGSSGK
jgi:dUTP pyrophosphatase